MQKSSLAVLDKLLANIRANEARNVAREIRLTDLLHAPEQADLDWFMYVDARFNAALALVETRRMTAAGAASVWTQGSNFSVTKGDIFYDNRAAYENWNPSNVSRCFVVTLAIPVAPGIKNGDDAPITPRVPGVVQFDILEPNPTKSALVKTDQKSMTQDEFIRGLIRGFGPQLTLAGELIL